MACFFPARRRVRIAAYLKPEVTEPMYRFERCKKLKGICKTFCNDHEYDYGYCIKWRNQCCI
ncbi:beta-defensin 110-like [Panthera tigris]|uniref:beta-defensin 110-like n=1 Tax=Panthera tigris TaxID=9694 RepID=UPI001C6F6D9B|nr:beta-defensin 110-like [Panthera tigris]